MRSLQLLSVRVEGLQDWKQLTAMSRLTCLKLSHASHDCLDSEGRLRSRAVNEDVQAVLAGLPCLMQLTVTDAGGNFLSGLNAPLTSLVFSLRTYSPCQSIADLARLTNLQRLVCTSCRAGEAKQIRSLTHIPNLFCC